MEGTTRGWYEPAQALQFLFHCSPVSRCLLQNYLGLETSHMVFIATNVDARFVRAREQTVFFCEKSEPRVQCALSLLLSFSLSLPLSLCLPLSLFLVPSLSISLSVSLSLY